MSIAVVIASAIASILQGAAQQPVAETIPAVGPTGPMKQVATGLAFTEGPAADAEGNLYFSDVRGNTVYRVDQEGNVSPFLEDSEGCNGLMFAPDGRLIACQGGAKRVVAIDPESKEITVLADAFDGQPLDRPNDLVIDAEGGVYFTDPSAGAVYYIDADRTVTRILTDLPRPNGVLLSPDGRALYVLPSGSPDVLSFTLEGPGEPGPEVVLCELAQAEGAEPRGGDGLTVDERGVLYLTQPALGAIQVVAPNGNTLGFLQVPENPSNCAFGGPDRKTLFITARTSVYALPMEAKGHDVVSSGE